MDAYFYDTALGVVGFADSGGALSRVIIGDAFDRAGLSIHETPLTRLAHRELCQYLAGARKDFDLPLAPAGTPFQRRVWDELQKIPYGQTRSYSQIAAAAGNPRAARAVGMANNKNPLPIFIPCHRVIGADGALTGYALGLDMKRGLLMLEQNPGKSAFKL